MPQQLKLGAILAEPGNNISYGLIPENKFSYSHTIEAGIEIEKQLYSACYEQRTSIEKRECKQRLQQFYSIALEHCFQLEDTDGIFYYMEQIKLMKLIPRFLENERHQPITIPALQKHLRTTHFQYLNYVETDTVIYTMLITADKVDCRKIFFPGYSNTLKEFLKICGDKETLNKNYNRYAQLSFLLYKKIFAPMQVSPGRILIATGEPLLPFEALTMDSTGNDFLLYHYSICYTYAATWHFRSPSKQAVGNGFLGIAPEYYSPGAGQTQLHGSVESLQKIEALFSMHNTLIWDMASKHNFLEAAGKYNVLHIYTHAARENGRQVLYMHDEALDMHDFGLLENVSLQLVFLAACETAIATDDEDEMNNSMADGFIKAGVPSAVATLWRTETKTMYAISEVFYRLLEQGLTKDEALRQAKIQFIKKEVKPNQLPYYWAAVILLGDAEPLIPAAESNASLYLAALTNISLCAVSRILGKAMN